LQAGAASYFNVNQSAPEVSATGSVTGTSLTTTLTTLSDNDWTVAFAMAATSPTAGAGTTKRVGSNSYGMFDSNAPITPPGSTSLTVNATNSLITSVMAAFSPPATPATGNFFLFF
jgi:hypothetical protein